MNNIFGLLARKRCYASVHRESGNGLSAGGGLAVKLGKSLLLRAIQLDYPLTRYQAPDVNNLPGPSTNRNQNTLRFAAGVEFNFGGAQ